MTITVNTPTHDHQHEVPSSKDIASAVNGTIEAFIKVYPEWTSMVIVFTNPKVQGP